MPAAADYRWIRDRHPWLVETYCLTLVRDVTPQEVLARLDITSHEAMTGIEAIVQPAFDAWDVHGGRGGYVAVTSVGVWALLVEPNGFLGTVPSLIIPLSAGTRLVSHFRNVNAADSFCWVEDGDVRLQFEPLFPTLRSGSDADGLVDVMATVGFDIRGVPDRAFLHHTEAAYALAETLTGVMLTAQLLETADFHCGTAPLPPP